MNPDTDSPLCPTWLYLNNANVHVAKDRGWFKTYTPFTSTLNTSPFFSPQKDIPVLGIGTVEIPTKRSPNASGPSSHGTLLLHDVLHAPDYLCNVIGQPLMDAGGHYFHGFGTKCRGTIKDSRGRNVAYFNPHSPLFAIKVRRSPDGPRFGPHALKKGVPYVLGCQWDDAEQRKWIEFKARMEQSSSSQEAAPYTAEEKAFLKKNYGSEWRFLMLHGLKIHEDEDREEGRAILRALMSEDEASSEEDGSDESQFEGHQADYNFTKGQLEWIEKHYRNSEQFMISYGLKFYDDEDLDEAKAIVNVMMHDDDDDDDDDDDE